MGNRRLYKIECLHTLGMPESERVKVTALNLFHPTAFPPFEKFDFFILRHSLVGGEGAAVQSRTLVLEGKGEGIPIKG